jgi:hypothetical protein
MIPKEKKQLIKLVLVKVEKVNYCEENTHEVSNQTHHAHISEWEKGNHGK